MMTATDITIPVQRHYEVYEEKKPAFLPFRFFFTLRQLVALAVGGAWAELRLRRERSQPRKWRYGVLKFALLFFYPYISMLSLFFGFDLAVFFVAGVIAVSYLFIKGREQKKYHLPFNAVLLFCSCIILGWAVLTLYDNI